MKKEKTFLLGTYRKDKPQIEWILGKNPARHQKYYNIRYNQDVFSYRRGGVLNDKKPDYILIYDKTGNIKI